MGTLHVTRTIQWRKDPLINTMVYLTQNVEGCGDDPGKRWSLRGGGLSKCAIYTPELKLKHAFLGIKKVESNLITYSYLL